MKVETTRTHGVNNLRANATLVQRYTMRTYAANIIPRLKQFSQKLDNKTLLMNQHWIMVDEITNTKTVYIFRGKNSLLISRDGSVSHAFWEMIDPFNVLMTIREESFMFKHGFLDEDVLALKLDGRDEYALFVNENRSSIELNSIKAIELFLEEKYESYKKVMQTVAPELDKNNETPVQVDNSMDTFATVVIMIITLVIIFFALVQ